MTQHASPRAGPGPHRGYVLGIIAVMMGGVFLSSGGLLVRHIDAADGWQIMFYRSLAFVLTVLVFLLWRYRGRIVKPFLNIGRPGLVVVLALGAGFTLYLFALLNTTVANVAFILSAGPFFSALLAWIILREKVALLTWVAMLGAMAGIGLMVANGLEEGHFLGNIIALGAPITFAVMIVSIRKAGARDMMPAICLAGLIAGGAATIMAPTLIIPNQDLILSLLLGSVQLAFGFMCITYGARYVPAAQVALLALTETVLAPTWVWLFLGETPSTVSLTGGIVVLIAVLAQGLYGLYLDKRTASDP
ncbi:MAG: DMT family transporter [Pseudomonadota bacterium]